MPMPAEIAQQKMKKPMSPSILEEIGALNEFPKLQANFDPDKNWSHLYRIWLNHGFWGQLNLDAGVLRIERKTGKSDDQFTLKIVQKAVNWEGIINTVHAQIECSNDSISSPMSWTYTSRFTDIKGNDVPELTVSHTVSIDNQTVNMDINGTRKSIRTGGAVTGDWCLFDAVQRLPFDKSAFTKFAVLEGLTALKDKQRLFYREKQIDGFKKISLPLYSFFQLGEGVLPYEYWLDKNHRLLMAISGDRLYIMDERAEETFAKEVKKHRGGEYSWQNKL